MAITTKIPFAFAFSTADLIVVGDIASIRIVSTPEAKELGVTPKLKIVDFAVAGFDAELMGYSPKFSSEKTGR